jgi:isoleucyl-tRNA synthetase
VLGLDADSTARKLLSGESIELDIDGQVIEVLPTEVEIQISPREGFTTAAEGAYVAALVTTLDQELVQEGLANEVVRRIQELRKQAGFSVDDRIIVEYSATSELMAAIEQHSEHIATETLGLSLEHVDEPMGSANEEYKFQEQELRVAISKAGQE